MKILSKKMTKSLLTSGLIAATLSSSVLLTGCGASSNEQTSTIAGSVIGGIIGRQFGDGEGRDVMTIVGAVVGGMIGGNMGRNLDRQDQQRVSQTLETAPNYKKVAWNNPNTNTQYELTPVSGAGQKCRDYVMDAWIDGRMQQVKGRACKNNQGQWVNAS
jgi:surface antigen